MADKNKPDHTPRQSDNAEQDDPFAELARLIAPRKEEAPRAPETAEDLADELLREFDAFPSRYAPDEPAAPQPEVSDPDPQDQPYTFSSFHTVDYGSATPQHRNGTNYRLLNPKLRIIPAQANSSSMMLFWKTN
nr:hypothetical protein [Marinicella sp. W31]MDC2877521.1 hypothetical protein [Marinicella sp. W31]